MLERTDEMTPSYTQCSGTLGKSAATEAAGEEWVERQRKVIAPVLF